MLDKMTEVPVNVMLDLETVGTEAGCGVLSIGACTFDFQHKFYERIDPASSRIYLKENIDTMRWWHKQDHRLREEAFGGTRELLSVLDSFHDWFRALDKNYKNILSGEMAQTSISQFLAMLIL